MTELVVAGKRSFNVLHADVCMIEDLIGGVVLIFRFDEASRVGVTFIQVTSVLCARVVSGRLYMAVVMSEEDMVVAKFRSVRSMRESVWWDAGLISLSGGMIIRVERQCDTWLYMSVSIIICTFLGR